jgi:type VII secretion effector (TIGR04197 family)
MAAAIIKSNRDLAEAHTKSLAMMSDVMNLKAPKLSNKTSCTIQSDCTNCYAQARQDSEAFAASAKTDAQNISQISLSFKQADEALTSE